MFSKLAVKTDACTEVSYLIAEKLAQNGMSLINRELIKKCVVIALNKYCSKNVNLVKETL